MNAKITRSEPLVLSARLDFVAGMSLLDSLSQKLQEPTKIDATNVTHLGAFSAQVLLAAQKQWAAQEQSFAIYPSEAFLKCWRTLGFPETAIEHADTI